MKSGKSPKTLTLQQLAAEIPRPLLAWFDQAKRDMPWRRTRDPYAIWLSETMLQQTQVETVKPFYLRFLQRFPTVGALAEAPLQDVLTHWAGLGYYRRAKHLHAAAQAIAGTHGGVLPSGVEALLTLPGIGRYTAGAVASIAFNLPAPLVDGNVMRVLARVTAYDQDIANPKNQGHFWEVAEGILAAHGSQDPAPRYGDVNQALMELGATVCVPPPAAPACLLCPLNRICRAFAEGRQMELPVKTKKAAVPVVYALAAVVFREGKRGREVLLMQRPAGGIWEHMWELPAVTAARGTKPEEVLSGALGLRLAGGRDCGEVRHTLTHRALRFRVHAGEVAGMGEPVLPVCPPTDGARYEAYRWVGYPLAAEPGLPLSRLVHKVLAAAETAGESAG